MADNQKWKDKIIPYGQRAKAVAGEIALLSDDVKNNALYVAAQALLDAKETILAANAKDLASARENGMTEGMQDRLRLDEARIRGIAEGIIQVSQLPDPLLTHESLPVPQNGLQIEKVTVPLGVIAVIYEARPNVTADVFALCFKSGNVSLLKGGKEALQTNISITDTLRGALTTVGIPADAVQLIGETERESTTALMQLREYVDLLIPRGGAGLIRAVVEESTIPVIETGTGNCHIFVDASADFANAVDIIDNAKTQRISVCNACESLVVHRDILADFLPLLSERLRGRVELRADAEALAYLPGATPATEEDWGSEYLDYILSVKTVGNLEEAIAHINRYHSAHSDAILTGNEAHAKRFLAAVDSACVYVNASTRFTDGFEFGFGAEIGISTQKMHARGPMGLAALTSYKYCITGEGQTRP